MTAPISKPTARCQYAELLRHFLSGRMTTDEYERRAEWIDHQYGQDDAVTAIREAAWFLYDDHLPYRLRGRHRLHRPVRRAAARWVLFLRSDAALAETTVGRGPSKFHAGRFAVLFGALLAVVTIIVGLGFNLAIVFCSALALGIMVLALFARVLVAILVAFNMIKFALLREYAPEVESTWPFASSEELREARHSCGLLGLRR